jgi:hypothetical protein
VRSLLNHVVHLERDVDTGDEDEYGHATTAPSIGQDFRAAIQPKSAREVALLSQAGADIADWTIYLLPRDVDTADKIVHVSADCPVREAADLPDATFELSGIRNAAGLGHHLEADARLVGNAAVVAGS